MMALFTSQRWPRWPGTSGRSSPSSQRPRCARFSKAFLNVARITSHAISIGSKTRAVPLGPPQTAKITRTLIDLMASIDAPEVSVLDPPFGQSLGGRFFLRLPPPFLAFSLPFPVDSLWILLGLPPPSPWLSAAFRRPLLGLPPPFHRPSLVPSPCGLSTALPLCPSFLRLPPPFRVYPMPSLVVSTACSLPFFVVNLPFFVDSPPFLVVPPPFHRLSLLGLCLFTALPC